MLVFFFFVSPVMAQEIKVEDVNLKVSHPPANPIYAPIKKSDVSIKKLSLFFEVRSRKGQRGVSIHSAPSQRAQAIYTATPGEILQIELTPYDYSQMINWEDMDTGGWRTDSGLTFENATIPVHTYFYWRDLTQLQNSSRGITLKPSSALQLPIVPISKDLPRDTLVDCTRPDMICMKWRAENFSFHLMESKLIQVKSIGKSKDKEWKIVYRVYILERGDAGDIWHEGWVFSDYLERDLEPESLATSYCLSSELMINRPAETEQFLFAAGIMKRPKIKNQKVGSSFFALRGGDPTGTEFDDGMDADVYNRWLDKMYREQGEDSEGGEVAYLFRLRPIAEAHAGISYVSYSQTGDTGELELSGFGTEVGGSMIFPLFLDFELHATGDIIMPFAADSEPDENLYMIDFTNDLYWAIPSRNRKINYFFGPGASFRSVFGPSNDLGFPSLFGLHLSGGFYSPKYFGFVFGGIVARDFNADLEFLEYGIYGGRNWYTKKNRRWAIGVRAMAFNFTYTQEEVLSTISTITTVDDFEVFRASLTGLIEF